MISAPTYRSHPHRPDPDTRLMSPARSGYLVATSLLVPALSLLAGCGPRSSPIGVDESGLEVQEAVVSGSAADTDLRAGPTFTPFTEAPAVLNRDEVVDAMVRSYPPLLRDAGIGGTARIYFFIDEQGSVQQVRLDRSSGHDALDQAALNVAGAFRFSPALNHGERVPAWVSFPITFRAD